MDRCFHRKSKPDYGVDAPGVVRNFFILGIVAIAAGFFIPTVELFGWRLPLGLFLSAWGVLSSLMSTAMFLFSRFGKMRHRDRMLSFVTFSGNQTVLDVGTGKGLLMIGAAKKLSTGKSYGIDIWNKEDLSDNSREATIRNADVEGVAGKVEIKSEDIQSTTFPDGTFDVVISNLCIHNIYNVEGRKKACREIGRILKETGTVVISDIRHIAEYAEAFREMGFGIELKGPYFWDTFPPLQILVARRG